jgi:hypothetical protein
VCAGQAVRPEVPVAAHRHARETQAAYFVSDELSFSVGGGEATVPAAGYDVVRPPVHSLWHALTAPGRTLEITRPAGALPAFGLGLRRFVRAEAEAQRGSPRHGTTFESEVTPVLCARHGMSPRPGYSVR